MTIFDCSHQEGPVAVWRTETTMASAPSVPPLFQQQCSSPCQPPNSLKRPRSGGSSATTTAAAASTRAIKAVSFAVDAFLYEYPSNNDVEDLDLDLDMCSQQNQDELQRSKKDCAKVLRHTYKHQPDYRRRLVQMFASPDTVHTEVDLCLLAHSPCRGLERKLDKTFSQHRNAAIGLVLQVQEAGAVSMQTQDHSHHSNRAIEIARTARHASWQSVHWALVLAAADRVAADEVYGEENDEQFLWWLYWWKFHQQQQQAASPFKIAEWSDRSWSSMESSST